MDNIISRQKIADGVYFNSITDDRYKVNRISVNIFSDLSENASLNALAVRVLSVSNKDFPTRKSLSEKTSSLYSAKIDCNISHIGDSQLLELYSVSIDNKYALEGEDLTGEITDILLNSIWNPALENGIFSEEILNQEKQAHIEAIESEINDKRIYTKNRMGEILFKGEPAALNSLGTVEGVRNVDSKKLYDHYRELLKTAPIEIFAIGCNDFKIVAEKLKTAFSAAPRGIISECKTNFSQPKAEVAEKIEKMQITQSKMALGYKTESIDFLALNLMTMIFGGMTTSKLFMNVREKMSLCYYCWAKFGRDKRVMTVDCGVEKDNIEMAKAEIQNQLAAVQNGDFEEGDILAAKLNIANNLKSFYDHPNSLINWYITRIYRNDIKSPEDSIKEYDDVTKERIIAAAKSISLDTVYVLTSE